MHKFGREWRVGADRFPISQTMTGVVLDLEPGGLRELHWHPNADEWQYVIDGQFSVSGPLETFANAGGVHVARALLAEFSANIAKQVSIRSAVSNRRSSSLQPFFSMSW